MLAVENKLFDEYKAVDSICRDIFHSQNGVTQYIEEMEQNSFRGRLIAPSWDDDYYKLKHIRWLRNRIAHESAATDCNENDVRWLTAFHHRLLNRQDPLALLNKADRERENFYRQNTRRPQIAAEQRADNNHLQNENNSSSKPIVKVLVFVEILVIIAVAAIFIKALMAM